MQYTDDSELSFVGSPTDKEINFLASEPLGDLVDYGGDSRKSDQTRTMFRMLWEPMNEEFEKISYENVQQSRVDLAVAAQNLTNVKWSPHTEQYKSDNQLAEDDFNAANESHIQQRKHLDNLRNSQYNPRQPLLYVEDDNYDEPSTASTEPSTASTVPDTTNRITTRRLPFSRSSSDSLVQLKYLKYKNKYLKLKKSF